MTAKLVSINTINGDDLTPEPACRPVQTISQRQAIKRICSKPDSTIWPVVEKRLSRRRPLSLFAFAASAVAVFCLVMLIADKLFR